MTTPAPNSVGILGGSFDPVHLGHISIAEDALKLMALNEVWFIPTAQSPFKQKPPQASAYHRLRMLKLALRDYEFMDYLDWEIEGPTPSYTIHTVERLKKEFPNTQFFWILGSDMLESLPQWHRFKELRYIIDFIVAERSSFTPPIPDLKLYFIKNRHHPASASEIRQRIKERLPLEDYLPESVINYIRINQLYI